MGARTTPPSARVMVSNAERIAQRGEAMEKIQTLLVIGRATVDAVAKHLGVPRATAYNYLRRMEDEGQARRTSQFKDKFEQWELGARANDTSKDTPARQSESMQVLEKALARPTRAA